MSGNWFEKIERLGVATSKAYEIVREKVAHYDVDRVMYLDINSVEEIIKSNKILDAVESTVGELKI